jgi:hypothetical protein
MSMIKCKCGCFRGESSSGNCKECLEFNVSRNQDERAREAIKLVLSTVPTRPRTKSCGAGAAIFANSVPPRPPALKMASRAVSGSALDVFRRAQEASDNKKNRAQDALTNQKSDGGHGLDRQKSFPRKQTDAGCGLESSSSEESLCFIDAPLTKKMKMTTTQIPNANEPTTAESEPNKQGPPTIMFAIEDENASKVLVQSTFTIHSDTVPNTIPQGFPCGEFSASLSAFNIVASASATVSTSPPLAESSVVNGNERFQASCQGDEHIHDGGQHDESQHQGDAERNDHRMSNPCHATDEKLQQECDDCIDLGNAYTNAMEKWWDIFQDGKRGGGFLARSLLSAATHETALPRKWLGPTSVTQKKAALADMRTKWLEWTECASTNEWVRSKLYSIIISNRVTYSKFKVKSWFPSRINFIGSDCFVLRLHGKDALMRSARRQATHPIVPSQIPCVVELLIWLSTHSREPSSTQYMNRRKTAILLMNTTSMLTSCGMIWPSNL